MSFGAMTANRSRWWKPSAPAATHGSNSSRRCFKAKFYADCLEKEFGWRPVIFYSNSYEN